MALSRAGHRVTVAEQAEALGDVGAGIQIAPNGMAVLRHLGLDADLRAVSLRARAIRLIDGPSDRGITTLDLKRHAPDLEWRLVLRPRLIDILARGAVASGARLDLGRRVEPGDRQDCDLVVAADGMASAHRARISPSRAAFSGQVAWRALVRDEAAESAVSLRLGPGRHLVSYPVDDGLINVVGVAERAEWTAEGWSHRDEPDRMRQAFAGFAAPIDRLLASVEDCHLWGLFRHPVATRWHDGRCVLLGEAAHPTLPFFAQGANLGLEDAAVLARLLSDLPMARALERYQALRRPRAVRVARAAASNAWRFHLGPPLRGPAHAALRLTDRLAPGAALGAFDWLYRRDVTADD